MTAEPCSETRAFLRSGTGAPGGQFSQHRLSRWADPPTAPQPDMALSLSTRQVSRPEVGRSPSLVGSKVDLPDPVSQVPRNSPPAAASYLLYRGTPGELALFPVTCPPPPPPRNPHMPSDKVPMNIEV